MEYKALDYQKKYVNLKIRYVHFDEYGSDIYDEEVKRLEAILASYEPNIYSLSEIVRIIRTVFKDNNENYLHVELSNHAQVYTVDFYDESLGKYTHSTAQYDYQLEYDPTNGIMVNVNDINSKQQFISTACNDIDMIIILKNIKPYIFSKEMAKCISLYESFFGKKIDIMNLHIEEELTYMLFLLNQYEMSGAHNQYYQYGTQGIEPSDKLKEMIFQLKSFVSLDDEENMIANSINRFVKHGVEDMGKAIAVHYETRTLEQQVDYLKKLCHSLIKPNADANNLRVLRKKDE